MADISELVIDESSPDVARTIQEEKSLLEQLGNSYLEWDHNLECQVNAPRESLPFRARRGGCAPSPRHF